MIISALTQKFDHAQKETFGVMAMYETKRIVGMFSGGHDSLLAVRLVAEHPLFYGVIWADTMTGTGETRQYIRATCDRYHWRLFRQAVHPMQYETLILRSGFPTPVTHQYMWRDLKDKPIRSGLSLIAQQTKSPRKNIAQVTGLRRSESTRRMAIVKHYHERRTKAGKLEEFMINPIWDWSQAERDDMINHLGLVRNAYADEIGHSYECMCFANVSKGEREHRARMSPQYEEIDQLREQMLAIAYRIQQLKIETGMMDTDDKVYLSSINTRQGWHLDHAIKAHTAELNNPFFLCAGCEGQRAADGTGGYDPDAEMLQRKAELVLIAP